MSKVKYLVGRIKNMNFKKMFDTIDDIHNRTDKTKIFLFFDMIIMIEERRKVKWKKKII